MRSFIAFLLSLAFLGIPHAQVNQPQGEYAPSAKIDFPPLNELSGLAPADRPGEFWGHNDSNDTHLYRFNADGKIQQVVRLQGVVNLDWEGMAADRQGSFYLGEIGDNNEQRQSYAIHIIHQPTRETEIVDEVKTCRFTYADGQPHNCEAVFYFNRKLYLITKEDDFRHKPTLFAIPQPEPGQEVQAQKIGVMNLQGNVTDAAYSPEHNQLAVLTYHGIHFFTLKKEDDLLQPAQHFTHSVFGWTEALCYDGDHLLVTDEPGYLFRKPLQFWLNEEILLPPALPTISLPKTDSIPKLDGDLSDWHHYTTLPIQHEVYSKYQTEPEQDGFDHSIRLQWTAKGLFLGFAFSRESVYPNFAENLMIMFSPKPAEMYRTEKSPIFSIFLDQGRNKKEWKIDDLARKEPAGEVETRSKNGQTVVEARISKESLVKYGLTSGQVVRFNLTKRERNRENRRVESWYWASRFSFVTNHPTLWGYLELE